MTLKKTLVAAVSLLALATPAMATTYNNNGSQPWSSYRFWDWSGAYVSAKGGFNWESDQQFRDGVKTDMDRSYAVDGAVGYQAAPGYRAEFEVGYKKADQNSVFTRGVGVAGADGDAKQLTLMANVYYDLNLAQLGLAPTYANMFTPYVGFGAGADHVRFDDYRPLAGASANDTDWVLAYQGIAGMAVNFTPSVSTTLEYRLSDTTNAEFHGQGARLKDNQLLAGVKFKY